jgi:hypothetical protein
MIAGILRGRGAGMIGQNAQSATQRILVHLERPTIAMRNHAMLLIDVFDQQPFQHIASNISNQTITAIQAPLCAAAIS